MKVIAWMPFKDGCDIDEMSDEEVWKLLDSIEPYDREE